VERADHRDDVLPARRVPGELDRALDGLGAGVREEAARTLGERRDPIELLADVGVDREVEVARRIVQELFGLSLDRGDHGGMGVAGRCDGDPRVHIEEQVAVDVLDHGTGPSLRHELVRAWE
jgi:hypothetical protein